MAETPADQLRALLEEERAVLRAGELERLHDIVSRKERLAAEVADAATDLPRSDAEALGRMARRNVELLEAAGAGLRAAIDSVAERARLARGFDTYDASGNRNSLGGGPRSLQRRF